MLQIITGKFFTSDNLNSYDDKGIFYSNALILNSIITPIGKIEPIKNFGNIAAYVFSYTNKIEKGDTIIMRTGDFEIQQQFKLICTFGLQSYFSDFREQVVNICYPTTTNKGSFFPASSFIPEYVRPSKGFEKNEIDKFVILLSKILDLDRVSYKIIMSALKSFCDSIEILEYNIDMAYSILIYCLESLSQYFEDYEPCWNDWEDSSKLKLDKILRNLPKDTAENIQDVLIENQQFKLQKRFINFILNNIDDNIFLNKNKKHLNNLRKSHLSRVLKNAYLMRSQFVHTLKPIQDQLRYPAIAQRYIFNFQGEPYLTYQGLLEITRNIIVNVIMKLPILKTESYNWKNELPGIVQLELDPSYWMGKIEGFDGKNANKYLVALFSQIESGKPITPLADLMARIEVLLPNSKNHNRRSMVLLYWLYNSIVPERNRMKNFQILLKKYYYYITELSIENIAIRIVLNLPIEYSYLLIKKEYEKYDSNRFTKALSNLPALIETVVLCRIANIAKSLTLKDEFDIYITKAICEISWNEKIQSYIIECKESYSEVDELKLIQWRRNELKYT